MPAEIEGHRIGPIGYSMGIGGTVNLNGAPGRAMGKGDGCRNWRQPDVPGVQGCIQLGGEAVALR